MEELERQKLLGPEEEPVEGPRERNVGTCGAAKTPGLRRGGGLERDTGTWGAPAARGLGGQ